MHDQKIYKILTPSQWDAFKDKKEFKGSEHDLRDGFIHMCKGDQLQAVIDKYFAKENLLHIACFESSSYAEALQWEAASCGDVFPHVYGDLHFDLVVNVEVIEQ